jgi:hypothetical protein
MIKRLITLVLALIVTLIPSATVYAINKDDYRAIYGNWPQYVPRTCNTAGSGIIPSGTLPSSVPEPHNGLFTQAAAKYNVNPQYIAALFLSEQGNVWKPFDTGWASSPVGASGPFQFMPGTWSQYGVDGDGNGTKDIQNMVDATHSAANYISVGFKTNATTPLGTLEKPFTPGTFLLAAAQYNWGDGNVSRKTTPSSPLSAAPTETQNYVKNIFTLIDSGFTKSGHSRYPDPTSQVGSNDEAPTTSEACGISGVGLEKVVNVAKAELAKDVKEGDENMLGYSDGNDEPWCADFVSWVFKESGMAFTGGVSGGWRLPAVTSMQAWFKENAEYFDVGAKPPQPGDVAFYIGAQTPDGGSQSHVNIVIAVNGDTMTTIGGNEGNAVTQSEKTIKLDEQGLVGFGRRTQ